MNRAPTAEAPPVAPSVNRQIFRAATVIGVLTLGVKLAGMAKEMTVAAWFGTGDALDAFLMALLLPAYAMNVLAGSFHAALVPIHVETRERHGAAEAQRLFSTTALLSTLLLAGATLLLAAAGPLLLPWLCSGFEPEKQALTVRLYYLLLPTLLIGGLAFAWEAVLNAGERFALPALAPAVVSGVMLTAVWIFGRRWGIYALAWGMLIGTAAHAVALGIGLRRCGIRLAPVWGGLEDNVRRVVGQYLPMVAGSLFFCSAALIDQAMAGLLPAGSVATLGYGTKLVALVTGIGTMALGTAVLPHFSKMVAFCDWAGIERTLRTYTRLILGVTIPVTLGAIIFSRPLVAFLFQRGHFSAEDTAAVAWVQQMLLVQLPFYSLSILYVRMISSLQGNRILMWGTGIGFAANISLNFLLMRWLGVAGIALATSLVYVIMCAYMAAMLRRRLRRAREGGL